MKSVFTLIAVALIGFTSSASAHECCAHKKETASCCSKKSKASCCAKQQKKSCCAKKAKSDCCSRPHGRAVLGYNGLGNPVHFRMVSHSGCKQDRAKAKCCNSGAAHPKVKPLPMDSPCPVAKPGCCAH